MNENPWRARYEALERERDAQLAEAQALESLLRRCVLRLCLAARGLSPALDRVLDRTSTAMRQNHPIQQVEPLLAELSDAVARTDTPVVQQAQQAASPAFDDELRQALGAVLERIELDPSLAPQAVALRGEIAGARQLPQATRVCLQLADLLAAQRERARIEQADVQRILLQVDTRLHEFVAYLRGEAADRQAADQNRADLDAQMLGEVRSLSETVQSAAELTSLRSQVTQRLEAMDAHLKQFRSREAERVEAYRDRAERMRERVEQLEGETRQLQASLAREHANATTDPLTGIPNRLAYQQRVALEFKRWKRFGRPLCLAAWDIDHFKAINDTHGHPAGDQVIRAVAKAIAGQIRETDFFARFGGEEFVLLLVDTPPDPALVVLEKLRRGVEAMGIRVGDKLLRVTVSAGVAEFRGDEDPDAVFARADSALYRAKRNGRNRCERA